MQKIDKILHCFLFLFLIIYSTDANAYIGPAVSLWFIGVLIVIVLLLLVSFIGIIYFPLKKYLKKRKK